MRALTYVVWFVILIVGVCVAKCAHAVVFREAHPPVYCLMVTGKNNDAKRHAYAQVSVRNFQQQTYSNKHLIIINEGDRRVLNKESKNSKEFQIKGHNLGTMRNIALEMVPPNAIWTTWDDDDWRASTYLYTLYSKLNSDPRKRYLMYCNRIDYNVNTNFAYRVKIPSGTYIFFAYKDPLIRYDATHTKEDAVVKRYILSQGERTALYTDNPYTLYVRFVHGTNTSVFVDARKSRVNRNRHGYLVEGDVTRQERAYVDLVKKNYI